jgi:hypothetical protein
MGDRAVTFSVEGLMDFLTARQGVEIIVDARISSTAKCPWWRET